jgi:hypothetical protein
VVETAKKRVSRDSRRGSIFDFFNNIGAVLALATGLLPWRTSWHRGRPSAL